MKRIIAYILCLSLILFAVSGCFNAAEETMGETDNAIENQNTASKSGGELRLAISSVDTMNPIVTQNSENLPILTLFFDALVKIDSNLNVSGGLAERFEISFDALKYTFYIRDGVKFHNGEPFSADDVEYTFNQIVKENNASIYRERLTHVVSAKAEGENKFVITLDVPQANFLNKMDIPIISKSCGEDLQKNKQTFKPNGTGKYMLSDNGGVKEIKLVSNNSWWGGTPYIPEITIIKLSDRETIAYAFKSGQVDVVTSDIIDINSYVAATENKEIKNYPNSEMGFLAFNSENPMFSGRNIRRAISFALDRDIIIKEALYGYGIKTNIPFIPGTVFYGEDTEKAEYSKEKAIQHLSADGAEDLNNDGIAEYNKDGVLVSVNFNLLVYNGNQQKIKIAEMVSKQLKEVGIGVNIVSLPWEEYNAKIESGDYDAFIGSVKINNNFDLQFMLHSSGYLYNGKPAATNPDLENIFSNMVNASNQSAIISVNNTLARYMAEYLPLIGIYFKTDSLIYNKRIAVAETSFLNPYNNIDKWFIK